MGCGASTPVVRVDDPPPASMEPELARLYEEVTASVCSSGQATAEPGETTRYLRLARKNLSARIFHGIDEDADQFQKEIDATVHKQDYSTALQIEAWIASVGIPHPSSTLECDPAPSATATATTTTTSGKYLDTSDDTAQTVPTRLSFTTVSDTLSNGAPPTTSPQTLIHFSSLPGAVSGPSAYLTMNKSVVSGTQSDKNSIAPVEGQR